MSNSDDDKPTDPTSYFLYELGHAEKWDATEAREHGSGTRETLTKTDFGNLPERVHFSELVMQRQNSEIRKWFFLAAYSFQKLIQWIINGHGSSEYFFWPLREREGLAYCRCHRVTKTLTGKMSIQCKDKDSLYFHFSSCLTMISAPPGGARASWGCQCYIQSIQRRQRKWWRWCTDWSCIF